MAISREQKREYVLTLVLGLVVICIALLIKIFIFQLYIVDGQSMENTLQDHDRLIVNKFPRTLGRLDGHAYIPKRGDIIVFSQDNLPGYVGQKQLIKRVIGEPGDHIVVQQGKLTIYNSSHPKGYDPDTTATYKVTTQETIGDGDWQLGPKQIFVMGDNRNNSEDSRYFGPVNLSQIVGHADLRIYPLGETHRL